MSFAFDVMWEYASVRANEWESNRVCEPSRMCGREIQPKNKSKYVVNILKWDTIFQRANQQNSNHSIYNSKPAKHTTDI